MRNLPFPAFSSHVQYSTYLLRDDYKSLNLKTKTNSRKHSHLPFSPPFISIEHSFPF